MEDSNSSSRPANSLVVDCYGSGAAEASSEDSGWTAYFDDDELLHMQAPADSKEEPEPRKKNKLHVHGGEFASATTVVVSSHASRSRMNKVKKKTSCSEEERKRPRLELEEDPDLLDTASSPLPPLQYCTCRMVLDLDVSRVHHQCCNGETF